MDELRMKVVTRREVPPVVLAARGQMNSIWSKLLILAPDLVLEIVFRSTKVAQARGRRLKAKGIRDGRELVVEVRGAVLYLWLLEMELRCVEAASPSKRRHDAA